MIMYCMFDLSSLKGIGLHGLDWFPGLYPATCIYLSLAVYTNRGEPGNEARTDLLFELPFLFPHTFQRQLSGGGGGGGGGSIPCHAHSPERKVLFARTVIRVMEGGHSGRRQRYIPLFRPMELQQSPTHSHPDFIPPPRLLYTVR